MRKRKSAEPVSAEVLAKNIKELHNRVRRVHHKADEFHKEVDRLHAAGQPKRKNKK